MKTRYTNTKRSTSMPVSKPFLKTGGTPVRNFEGLTDQEVWRYFVQGNEDAFIFLYHKWFDKLYGYGCQFTTDTEMVKDAIQELFVAYLNTSQRSTINISSIKFYLFTSLRNRLFKTIKKEKFMGFMRSVELPEHAFGFESAHDIKLISQQLDERQSRQLIAALNTLTLKQREAITYYFYEEMSYAQVATIMNLKSAKYARKLIYRAIASLREIF